MYLFITFRCFHAAMNGNIFRALGTLKGTKISVDRALDRLFYEIIIDSDALIVFAAFAFVY